MKHLKHLFTALLLLCSVGTATAHDFEVGGIYYNITNDTNKTVEVTYKGTSYYSDDYTGGVVIPESVTYNGSTYSVTSIGYFAFYGCSGLTSITIPNSVTSFGNYAFYECSGLTSITIPNSVTSIGDYAFYECSGLTSITIPNSVTSIKSWAFAYCFGLTSITIPNSVTSIRDFAFYGCTGLTSITIPNSVTSIGNYAFEACTGLTNVVIGNSVTSIGWSAFSGCTGLTNVVIGNSVTSIGYHAFEGCSALTSITIPNSVTSIEGSAFEGTAWYDNQPDGVVYAGKMLYGYKGSMPSNTSITIKEGTLGIAEGAFAGCSGLTSITIPNSVTSIGDYAFQNCTGLKTVYNFSNLTFSKGSNGYGYIAYYADKVYNVPNGSSIEGDFIFGKPNDVNSLLYYLGNATELTLPADYKGENYVIGTDAFNGNTTITSVEIPSSVTSIGEDAFEACTGLTSVVIGNSVTSIGKYAFYKCTGLTSITIPNSVTSIGNSAFRYCNGLKTVYNFSNLTFSKGSSDNGYIAYYADNVYNVPNGSIEGDFIFGKPNDVNSLLYYLGNATELTLPADCKGENYVIGADAFNGNTTITSVEIPSSVTSIGKNAFYECTKLTSVVIGNSVTSIGNSAFYGCTGLTSVTIGNSVTSIGEYAFYKCTGLTSITIPNSVTSIGISAFEACTGLTSVVIGNSVTSIGYMAFYNCTGLTSITIPNSVTYIANEAFKGCSGLTSVEIGNSVTSIGNSAFENCRGLTSVEFNAEYCTSMGYDSDYPVFKNCTALSTVTIGENVKNIPDHAFYECTGLTSVVIGNSVTSIRDYAFYNCTGLKTIYNFSNLTFTKGLDDNGYIAYYADKVYNAPNGSIEGDFIFGKPNDVNLLLYYLGNATELTLPADCKGENYVIGADAFNGNTTITSITIPNSVTSIGHSAFNGCTGLTSITIPNSVTSIGYQAFSGCTKLTSITIPNSVTSIGDAAFQNCKGLTSITIPNSVTSIGIYAFYWCTGLTNVVIGNSVTSIGNSAFYDCFKLKTVINLSNLTFSKGSSNNGYIAYYADKVINAPNGFIDGDFVWAEINDVNTLACYLGNATELTLPADYKGENYVIGADAFNGNTTITSVEIPSSVTSIGNNAFYNCAGLKTVYNFSNLTFTKGSSDNGYIAYYADKVYNVPNGSIEGDFIFGKPNDVNTLLYYLGNATELTLPADYKGENYVIGADAFNGNTTITSVEIPSSVTSIGNDAFRDCTGLKTVYNFSNLTFTKGSSNNGYIAYYADKVYNAPNGSIEGDFIFGKPNDVNTLLYYLGNATELTLPADCKGENYVIGANAFNGNKTITSITIPNSVTSIGNSAFAFCTGLTSITIPNSVTSIGNNAFYNCAGLTSITIPNSVTSIGDRAFYWCSGLENITIPNSVTSIGEYAFHECFKLTAVHISDIAAWCGIDFDGSSANPFNYADNLYLNGELVTELTIPNSVTSIGNYAFYNCDGLTSITIGNSVTSIGKYAFYDCTGLKTVYNYSNLTFTKGSDNNGYIAYYADNVYNAPNGYIYIDGDFVWAEINDVNALAGYLGNATELTFPADYKGENYVIGADAFDGNTTITSITIPNSVTSIGNNAFSGCTGLTSITIPNNVTSIGYYAFEDCTGLTSITIPNSVTSIGWGAFEGCTGLAAVHISDIVAWCGIYFDSPAANPLYYLGRARNLYLNDELLTELSIPTEVTEVKDYAFFDCKGLTSITIPNSVTSIGESAFWGCDGLTSVVIGNSVTSIGNSAFSGCSGLTSIEIPNSVTSIGEAAFSTCDGLTSITIPNSVTSIGKYAFNSCDGLTSITIPNSVTSIGEGVFNYCTGLTSITIPNSVTSIGTWVFYNCDGLKNVEFNAENCATMGSSYYPVFEKCTALSTVTIGENVKNIPPYAFYGCSGLTEIFSNILAEDLFIPGSNAFAGVDKEACTLYVPYGAKETYDATASWNEFANIVEMDPSEYELTVSAAGYATLYLDYATVIPEGVEVYTAKEVDGNRLKMELVEEDVLPANTAVIVKAAEGSYTFVQTDEVISEIADNLLSGSVEDEYINVPSNQKAFVLSRVDGEVGMYLAQLTDGRFLNNANKAYLLLDDDKLGLSDEELGTSVAGAHLSLRFDFSNTTAIESIENNDANSTLYYDLSGRRVENPTRGIYIVNGKKVLVK